MREFFELAILVGFAVAFTGSLIAAVAHFPTSGHAGQGRRDHLKQAIVPAEDQSPNPRTGSKGLRMSRETAGYRS